MPKQVRSPMTALDRGLAIAARRAGMNIEEIADVFYGPYNWRDNAVLARVYIAAAVRHINFWASGEELADDSGVHHLGHAIACLAILLDAQTTGNLIDDRAKSEALVKAIKDLDAIVKAQAEARAKTLETI